MSLPAEIKLQTVLQEKDEIRKATDEISVILKRLGKGIPLETKLRMLQGDNKEYDRSYYTLDEESALAVRQKIHQVVKSLSIIAGFCDNRANQVAHDLTLVVSRIMMKSKINLVDGKLLELFCTIVNGLVVDFNKTPFSFSGEFKVAFDKLMASVKATYKKGKIN